MISARMAGNFEEMIMKRKILFARVLLTIVTLAVGAGASAAQKIESGFLNRSITVNKSEYRYVVYVPREFTRSRTWPVILALHGGGDYGSDGLKHTASGLANAIRRNPERFPAIVVFPQAKADGTPGWQVEGGDAALAALDKTVKEFNGDPDRVVLTGYSAGGNGTWSIASRYPRRFAAIVPICGFVGKFKGKMSSIDYPSLAPADAGDVYKFVAGRVSSLPIWIFHGDADQNVDVSESRQMAAALKAIGANAQYTELLGVDHNGATNTAYARADLIEWMLRQRRR
jgi:predicted peptidase